VKQTGLFNAPFAYRPRSFDTELDTASPTDLSGQFEHRWSIYYLRLYVEVYDVYFVVVETSLVVQYVWPWTRQSRRW